MVFTNLVTSPDSPDRITEEFLDMVDVEGV